MKKYNAGGRSSYEEDVTPPRGMRSTLPRPPRSARPPSGNEDITPPRGMPNLLPRTPAPESFGEDQTPPRGMTGRRYAKGGKVKGCGIARKGLTRGKMV